MLVQFVASLNDLKNEIEDYRQIVHFVHKEGHVLAQDWLEPAYSKVTKSPKPNWKETLNSNIKAISKCDVLIAEVTSRSFEVGYQVGLAVSQKKPILLLRKEGSSEETFLDGLEHHYIKRFEYSDKNLENIIADFLKENDMPAKDMRFNFFIDRPIYNYLKWVSLQSGKTKAEILRELVLKEISKNEEF